MKRATRTEVTAALRTEADDLQAALDRVAADAYSLVVGVAEYEDIWRMARVRGPEGILVSLSHRID